MVVAKDLSSVVKFGRIMQETSGTAMNTAMKALANKSVTDEPLLAYGVEAIIAPKLLKS
jgi:hypothetical protein